MKKSVLIGALLLLSLGMSVYAGGKSQQVRMATGGNTGTYYSFGSAVGQILTEKTGIPITIQSTGASKANIQLIDAGEVELAIVQNDVMDYAWKGIDLFNGEKTNSFRSMAALYAEVCQVVANPASGIRTIADLKGKRVSVGDAGSGTEFNARQILEAYGVSFDTDIEKQNLSFGASADALRDNKIDAFFCVAGAPTPAIQDLAATKDIVVLEVDNPHIAVLSAKYPFYTAYPVPADYRGQSGPVQTVAVKATFIVSEKLSEDTVYQLTKNLFESKEAIVAAHAKGSELSPAYAVEGISVEFHPGAAKYLREIGALK